MNFRDIDLQKLIINPENDRHGPLTDEGEAIRWLLTNKLTSMKKLAERITKDKRIYEPPIVVQHKHGFIVKDGNRRVTSLKLICDPTLAPYKHRKFYQRLSEQWVRLPKTLTCQLELLDEAEIIVDLKHSGAQDGEGQIQWGPQEKANYLKRLGKQPDYPLADRIKEYLEQKVSIETSEMVNVSTLERLLGPKKIQNRLGIKLDENDALKLADPIIGHQLLIRLATDMDSKTLKLGTLLEASDRDRYISDLEADKLLSVAPSKAAEVKKASRVRRKYSAQSKRIRKTLIPQNIDFSDANVSTKIEALIFELQFQINLPSSKLSCAILFRVFLEQISTSYMDRHQLTINNNTLVRVLSRINSHLCERRVYDARTKGDCRRVIEDENSNTSVYTLHRALHSKFHTPSHDDLISTWDNLEPLILAAMNMDNAI